MLSTARNNVDSRQYSSNEKGYYIEVILGVVTIFGRSIGRMNRRVSREREGEEGMIDPVG